jgi:hypothetical protein
MYVYPMTQTLLTTDEQKWVDYHMQLATVNPDRFEFSPSGLAIIPTELEAAALTTEDSRDRCACEDCQEGYTDDCELDRADLERQEFLKYCKPAGTDDYVAWFRGLKARGIPHNGNRYGYTVEEARFYFLVSDPAYVPELYGAFSVNVIVPAHSKLTLKNLPKGFHGCPGHSTFYFMDGFKSCCYDSVHTYKGM